MRVLIQCGDHLENQQRISLLGRILLKNQVDFSVLMYEPGKGSFLKSEGFKVIYLNEYMGRATRYKKPILNPEVVLKAESARKPELIWPSKKNTNLRKSLEYIYALNDIIEEIKPDHICIWNGFTGFVANVFRLLAEEKIIECSFLERGLFKDSLFIDRFGVNGASSLSKTGSSLWERQSFSIETKNTCHIIFNNKFVIDANNEKRIIFFPLQVQMDTNIIYYSPYRTMREAFFKIYERFNDGNTLFVLRPHPEEVANSIVNLPILDNVIISNDKSLEFWIDVADVIVTINSTVGLEAVLRGKRTVCLGQSIYSGLKTITRLDERDVKDIDHNEVFEYCCFILENNLIKSNSDLSSIVAQRNIGFDILHYEVPIPYSIACKELSKSLLGVKTLSVCLNFNLSKKLDITYRNNSLDISVEYIKKLLTEKFPNLDFDIKNETANNSGFDLEIVDDDWCGTSRNRIVMDYYGAFKCINGVKFI